MVRIVEDVGAPGAVILVDQLTLELAPDYNEIASYVMTGAGYAAGFLGFGGKMGDFLLKMGIASAPLTARAIRERVKGIPVSRQKVGSSRMAFVRSNPASHPNPGGINRSYQPEFEAVAPHAF